MDYSPDALLARYFALMRERPDLFANGPDGGIKILTSRPAIAAAQEAAGNARSRRCLDTSDLRVGVIASDPYMMILRDAVRFPDHTLGLYNRIVELKSVAVLPLLDAKPVLVRIFRHGMRDWSLEFPRGGCDFDEYPEMAVRREIREEIGAGVRELIPPGDFTPGGSSLSIRAHLYAASIDAIGSPDRGDGIAGIEVVSVTEVERLIRAWRIIDGFTLSTFLRARLAGII